MHNIPEQILRANWRRDKIFAVIRKAAIEGKPAPTNAELAKASGHAEASVKNATFVLALRGLIRSHRFGNLRIFEIPGEGLRTADPRKVVYSAPKRPVHEIVQIAAEIFQVPATGIIGLSRKQHLVRARQAVCKVAYDQGWSSPLIGKRLSGRDQVEIHAERDELFAARYQRLARQAKPAEREVQAT